MIYKIVLIKFIDFLKYGYYCKQKVFNILFYGYLYAFKTSNLFYLIPKIKSITIVLKLILRSILFPKLRFDVLLI